MADHELQAHGNAISLDGARCVVGITSPDQMTNNQTRTAQFSPRRLVEWARAVEEAYGGRARLVFTPDSPLVATDPSTDDPDVGICISPIVPPEHEEVDVDD